MTAARPVVAVTGATGHLGGQVARRLAEQGVTQRLVVRDPSRAPELAMATVARATYDEPDALQSAFAGADTLLLVSAAEHPDRLRQHRTAVDAAVAAGVQRVVYTSFLGAAPDATFVLARQHHATEQHIRASGLRHTILRNSMYMDFVPFLASSGAIAGPARDGRVAMVARDDVVDVVVAVLLDDRHDGRTYDVTGARLQTLDEVAAELSEILGRRIPYVEETIDRAWESRRTFGAPEWEVEGWISSYLAIAAGEMAVRSDTVQRVAGHEPLGLRELLARHPSLLESLRREEPSP